MSKNTVAHSGNPSDKAPLVNSVDISSVAKPRAPKQRGLQKPKGPIIPLDSDISIPPVDNQTSIAEFVANKRVLEPTPVKKNEERLPTEPDSIILNLVDCRLKYYADQHYYFYRFEGLDAVVVGKYVSGAVKLEPLTAVESANLMATARLRYVYDNNYFISRPSNDTENKQ